jgi:hypothetical protein
MLFRAFFFPTKYVLGRAEVARRSHAIKGNRHTTAQLWILGVHSVSSGLASMSADSLQTRAFQPWLSRPGPMRTYALLAAVQAGAPLPQLRSLFGALCFATPRLARHRPPRNAATRRFPSLAPLSLPRRVARGAFPISRFRRQPVRRFLWLSSCRFHPLSNPECLFSTPKSRGSPRVASRSTEIPTDLARSPLTVLIRRTFGLR